MKKDFLLIFFCSLYLTKTIGQEIELAVPRYHTQTAKSLSLSDDGKFLLTASDDKTVILREVSSGNYLRMFEVNRKIAEVKFLFGNRHFVVNTDTGMIVYDVSKKQSLQIIPGSFLFFRVNKFRREFTGLKADGSLSIYKDTDCRFNYYKTIDTLKAGSRAYFNYSADGEKILYYDRGVHWIDIKSGTKKNISLTGISDSTVNAIALHADNNTLAVGLSDGNIGLYSISAKATQHVLKAYSIYWKGIIDKGIFKDSLSLTDPVRDLEFMRDNNLVSYHSPYTDDFIPGTTFAPKNVGGKADRFVNPEDLDKMWDQLQRELDSEEGDPLQTKDLWGFRPTLLVWNLKINRPGFMKLTADPISIISNYVATPQSILNLQTREEVNIGGENTIVGDARFSSSGKFLLFYKNYKNNFIDLESGTGSATDLTLMTNGFSFHKDLLGVKAGTGYYDAGLWDLNSKRILKTISNLEGDKFVFNPEKEQIVFRTWKDSIRIVDFSGKQLFLLPGKYTTQQFSDDGGICILSDEKRTLFFETNRFTLIDSLPRYRTVTYQEETDSITTTKIEGYIERVDKFKALRNLVYITNESTIIVRDAALKKTVDTLRCEHLINCLAISPDGNTLVAGSIFGDLTFFDLKSKKSESILAHDGIVNAVDFNLKGNVLISVGRDGLIKFWDVVQKKVLTRLLFYGDDWVAVNQDGLFDGSAGGLANLFFINGLQTIELSQLKDRFYEPGLLAKVLGISKEQLRKSQGLRNIKLFPKIDLTLPDENGTMIANVSSQGGGIGRIKIFINGKEAMADARGMARAVNKDNISIRFPLRNHPLLKANEVNLIEVKAFNEDGYLESPAKKVYYLAPGESQVSINLFALVIGISDYNGTQLDLRYAAKDAEQFALALSEESSKLFGKDRVRVELLTTNSREKWPTKSNIKKAFADFAKRAKPNDILIVYLAGHGLNYGGEESDFYYLTADAQNGNLQDPVVREEIAISSHEFTEYIKTVPALKQIMILDACHSGKFAEDLLAKREAKSASEIRALERMKDRTGMYILSGSAADAVSYEASSFGQGLLTYSLLLGMKGAALRERQYLDVMNLFQYCVDEVPLLAQNIGGIQKPELRVPYAAESFDIGMLDEEINKKIILPTPKPVFIRSAFQDEDTFGDPLELSDQLDALLKTSQTELQTRGIIFIDAAKYSDGYSLRGRYKKTGEVYEVSFKLLKGDHAIKDFHSTGEKPEELAKKIVQLSTESLPH